MRLLDTTSLEFHVGEHATFRHEGYATLSHRWVGQEITLDQFGSHVEELRSSARPLSPQLEKIRATCATARSKGIKWIWIDSCCIDKRDMVELTESINSMYKWYRDSVLCIVYLYDVKKNDAVSITNPHIFNRIDRDEPSEWFSRGWTLQELLAPREMEFYDKEWTYMGTKKDMKTSLGKVTGINEIYLSGQVHFRKACIAVKMSWMARRKTTRREDVAYSMVGLFGITMTPVYGEGHGAFARLQEILMSWSSMDESLFAWKMPAVDAGDQYKYSSDPWQSGEWGLLAPSPEWFADCGAIMTFEHKPPRRGLFTMSPNGIQAPVGRIALTPEVECLLCMAWFGFVYGVVFGILPCIYYRRLVKKVSNEEFAFKLQCFEPDAAGNCYELEPVEIYLRPIARVEDFPPSDAPIISLKRVRCTEFGRASEPIKAKTGLVPQPSAADL
ncbi:hypothetical protein N8I77_013293 [Diaporthe amygdali]|uniref:Heterokaryon incompatibility domain-containing protein n=1 Tax=Phomopsis amygdali TaxID=1214568 RepID=A0AAD9S2F8_PHOAM|nr:hypothetical protein N8I77_013293 [Diaporthe amygdali]